jgi:hypothetical protein
MKMKVKLEKSKAVDLYALQARKNYMEIVGIDDSMTVKIIIGGVVAILALVAIY